MFAPYRSISYKYNQSELQSARQQQYIETLEKKLEETSISMPTIPQGLLRFHERTNPDKKTYASELSKQIEEKNHKISLERERKIMPGFSEGFQVYPNRPQTPKEERRERARIRMREIKDALDEQVQSKEHYNNLYRSKELEAERSNNLESLQKAEQEKKERMHAKSLEKEVLTSSWQNARKTKEIVSQIDCIEHKGFNPRSRSIAPKDERGSVGKVDSEEVKTSQKCFEKEMKSIDNQIKMQIIKNEIDKRYQSSYQLKIKQMLSDAKSQRKMITQSLSPSNFAEKKKKAIMPKFGYVRRFKY